MGNEESIGFSPTRQRLEALIDWYEQFKPDAGKEILVGVTRKTVLRWGIKPEKRGEPIQYRGRLLVTNEPRP